MLSNIWPSKTLYSLARCTNNMVEDISKPSETLRKHQEQLQQNNKTLQLNLNILIDSDNPCLIINPGQSRRHHLILHQHLLT